MFKGFHVGGRIIKTGLAVAMAVFLAQSMGLERVTLAAVVALVTVQRTFYHSVVQSAGKVVSVLFGAVTGAILGYFLGSSPFAFFLVTVIIIITLLKARWQAHIPIAAISAVHLISYQGTNYPLYSLQQIGIALLGASSALLVNFLFTPNYKGDVKQQLIQVEEELGLIMDAIAEEILHPGSSTADNLKLQASQVKEKIAEGMESSKLFQEEQRFQPSGNTVADEYRQAFRLLDSQIERLLDMHTLAARMVAEIPHAEPLAKLLRILKRAQYNALRGKKCHYPLLNHAITNLEVNSEGMDLPSTRKEFITRASLFHLSREMRKYYNKTKQLPPVLKNIHGK